MQIHKPGKKETNHLRKKMNTRGNPLFLNELCDFSSCCLCVAGSNQQSSDYNLGSWYFYYCTGNFNTTTAQGTDYHSSKLFRPTLTEGDEEQF